MSLLNIGARCALPSCTQIDLLPLTCFCDSQFCSAHIRPDDHQCTFDAASPASALEKLSRCAYISCKRPSLEAFIAQPDSIKGRTPAICSRCSLAYCATHREPSSHTCPVPQDEPKKRKNEAAHAILAKRFPAASFSSKPISAPAKAKPPSDPKKLAQLHKIELMKMRHHAAPANPEDTASSVPLEQRLFVTVTVTGSEAKTFWLRKSIGTGRALDILAGHFKLSASDAAPLQLAQMDGDKANVLRKDIDLSEQIEDGSRLFISHALL